MSLAIKHGLFQLNITDHHAILGVSIDGDAKQIRLRYLKIAQQLHPDTYKSDPTRKEKASKILSKLVNPAYEQLSRKNTFAEHQLVLTQIGKHLAEKKEQVSVKSEIAQELLKSANKLELVYPQLLKSLVTKQYKSLDKLADTIAKISELNLVYLMLKSKHGINREANVTAKPADSQLKSNTPKPSSASPPPTKNQSPPTQPQAVEKEEPTPESRILSYVRRAEQYMDKGDYIQAITELRDALKIDPNNSKTHALMGKAYIHRDQLTMAKVHINKACKVNPNDPVALEAKKLLDKLTKKKSKSKASADAGKKSGSNSFLSGFFGAKKK